MAWQETQDAVNRSADLVLTSGPGGPLPVRRNGLLFRTCGVTPNGQGFCPGSAYFLTLGPRCKDLRY